MLARPQAAGEELEVDSRSRLLSTSMSTLPQAKKVLCSRPAWEQIQFDSRTFTVSMEALMTFCHLVCLGGTTCCRWQGSPSNPRVARRNTSSDNCIFFVRSHCGASTVARMGILHVSPLTLASTAPGTTVMDPVALLAVAHGHSFRRICAAMDCDFNGLSVAARRCKDIHPRLRR